MAIIVAANYAGLVDRARDNAAKTALTSAQNQITNYRTLNNEQYPATLEDAGVQAQSPTEYFYELDTSINPSYYCLTAEVGETSSYFLTSRITKPAAGNCIDLEAWWPFNNTDNDLSKYDRDPNNSGAAPSDGQNDDSGSYQFGTGNGFTIPSVDGGVLQDTSYGADWSLAAWVQSTGVSDDEALIVGRVGCNGGLYTQSGNYQFAIKTSQANCWSGYAGLVGIPVDTNWHHLAGVYQGGTMRFYADGQLVNTGFIAQIYGYSTTLRIGGTGSRTFNGRVDDVRIYSRAMTPGEIRQVYSEGAY